MTKKLSPPQKWPHKYSIRGKFWDSDGLSLEIKTDLPYALWKDFIQKVQNIFRVVK